MDDSNEMLLDKKNGQMKLSVSPVSADHSYFGSIPEIWFCQIWELGDLIQPTVLALMMLFYPAHHLSPGLQPVIIFCR